MIYYSLHRVIVCLVAAMICQTLYANQELETEHREFRINSSVDPCLDFYEYACSETITSFELPADRSRYVFSFSDASEKLLKLKKKYLSELAAGNTDNDLELEIKKYYSACMNVASRAKEEVELVEITKEQLSKATDRDTFLGLLSNNLTKRSKFSFISIGADAPNHDLPAYNDLILDANLMSLPERSYYYNQELVDDFKRLLKDFFIAIGVDEPKKRADLVFNFEKKLAEIYPLPYEIRERYFSRNYISRSALINKYPNLRLKKFLDGIDERVVIRDIVGEKTLAFLDKKLHFASLEELKSVFLYFSLSEIMDDAYPDFYQAKFQFKKKHLGGVEKRPDREERCTRTTMSDFEMEIDYLLLPKVFPNFPKKSFIKSVEKIRLSLLEQLKTNAWLSKAAKQEAIRKISKVKLAMVSPNNKAEWNFNPRANYRSDTPIANQYLLADLLFKRDLKNLKGPVNTSRWQMGPLTVNAYYSPSYNRVVFPVGILQYPFFDPQAPEEVNLGAIGTVIGHELGHAIDNHGNNYNAEGVLKPWMSIKDRIIFNLRASSLVKQFNAVGHNGKFTLGENIGDLVGLTTSYLAAFGQDSGKIKLKQDFFLQYARIWCEIERPAVTLERLKTDPHALGKARVNEQLKHQPGFMEAYGCKFREQPVAPKRAVKIW